MAAEVDVGYVSSYMGLETSLVSSAITSPTQELVASILQAVAAKGREFDVLASDKVRVDIELESAVRNAENIYGASKATADKALKDAEELRQKLQGEEQKRLAHEDELRTLRSRAQEHDAEIKSLRVRVESAQDSNRANMSIIDERNRKIDELSNEMVTLQQKNTQLNKEITTLSQSVRASEAAANSARYKEEALKQQLDLTNKNKEWFEREVKTKGDEVLKLRKEKGAQIADLQRQNNELRTELEALKRSESQLRERFAVSQAKTEELLGKIQQKEESSRRQENDYEQEIRSRQRLVEISEELADNQKRRVKELDEERERLKSNAEAAVNKAMTSLEREKAQADSLQEQVTQLEAELDELRARASNGTPGSAPQTPRPNGSLLGRLGSPFTPATGRKNAHDLVEDLFKVKSQLSTEKRQHEALRKEFDHILELLEATRPEVEELQAEVGNLQAEITKMSELSQASFEERDSARKAARMAESDCAAAQTELQILRTQLRDMSLQVQMLVFKVHILETGEELTDEVGQKLERLSQGRMRGDSLDDMSDTQQFITERFAIFGNIAELRQKHEDMLKTTRMYAEQMESEEALAEKHKAAEAYKEVERLKQDLALMTDEVRSSAMTMESFKTERDMFRRLLQQKASHGEIASAMGSNFGESRPPLASIEGGMDDRMGFTDAQVVEKISELETRLDETRKSLSAQEAANSELLSQKKKLEDELVTAKTERAVGWERLEIQKSTIDALEKDKQTLQDSIRYHSNQQTQTERQLQEKTEELVNAQGIAESLRSESSGLKAEKDLWQNIQERLRQDNQDLVEEKSRLNDLVATQQNMLNERDISDREEKRRLQGKIDNLEQELTTVREKLSKESEDSRNLRERKDFEAKGAQKRIDELMASVRQSREELVAVKTSKDHMEARVNELSAELRNADERFGRLLPRATPRPGVGDGAQDVGDSASQELLEEISRLKRDLEAAKEELQNAVDQMEHHKQIGRQTEEALEELTASHNEYSQTMDAELKEKDEKIKDLTQRFSDVSTELANTNNELSELRDSQGEVARKFEDEKKHLGEDNERLRKAAERAEEMARYHQQDLRAQADIATKAQQDYEQELVKHAEAAQALHALRSQHNETKTLLATAQAQADSARVALEQAKESWEERESALKQEVLEITARRNDATAQVKLLHGQLDFVSKQVSELQEGRTATIQDLDGSGSDSTLDGLRELNAFLRREKEILEVQYDIKTSEARRLQEHLDVARMDLHNTQLKLEQERQANAQSGRIAMTHQQMMEKLEELNLYRESSATLRMELDQSRKKADEKQAAIDQLRQQLQPIQAKVEELQMSKGFLEDEIKSIQEDRDRWKERAQDILTKYGRVDPQEMEELNQRIKDLEAERDTLKAAEQPLKAKVDELTTTLESEKANWQTSRTKLIEHAKERSRKQTAEKVEILSRATQLEAELASATASLNTANEELSTSKQQASDFERQMLEFQQQVQAMGQAQQANGVHSADAAQSAEVTQQLEASLAAAQSELGNIKSQQAQAESQVQELTAQLETAHKEKQEATTRADQLATQIAALSGGDSTANGPAPQPPQSSEQSSASRPDLEQKIKEYEARVSELTAKIAELEQHMSAAEARAAEAESRMQEIEAKNTETLKARSDKMKVALNDKLKETRAKLEEEFQKKLAEEKASWQAENAASAQAPKAEPGAPPATPTAAEAAGPPSAASAASSEALLKALELSDMDTRAFITQNPTVKSIITGNVKKMVDAKIEEVKKQTELMAMRKNSVKINMLEKTGRANKARLDVVETAAKETPQRPVGQVWEIAKTAQPPPSSEPAPSPGLSRQPSSVAPPSASTSSMPPSSPAGPPPVAAGPPAAATPTAPASASKTPAPANPFVQSASSPGANPFKVADSDAPPTAPATQPARGSGIPRGRGGRGGGPGRSASMSGEASSNIPVPGGGGARGGPHGRGGRGGRGGGGLNAGATEFNPGAKRPRGDSEAAGGAKRARGAH